MSKWFMVWCGARVEVFEAEYPVLGPTDYPLYFVKEGKAVAVFKEWDYHRAFDTKAAAEAAAGY